MYKLRFFSHKLLSVYLRIDLCEHFLVKYYENIHTNNYCSTSYMYIFAHIGLSPNGDIVSYG